MATSHGLRDTPGKRRLLLMLTLVLAILFPSVAQAQQPKSKPLRVHWIASNWAAFHGLNRQSVERLSMDPQVASVEYSHSRIWPLHAMVRPEEYKIQFYPKQTRITQYADFLRTLDAAEYDILAVAVQLKMIAKDSLANDYEKLFRQLKQRARKQEAELILVTYANTLDEPDRQKGRERLLQLAGKFEVKVCPWWDVMSRMRDAKPDVPLWDAKVKGHPSREITYALSHAFRNTVAGHFGTPLPVQNDSGDSTLPIQALQIGDWDSKDEPITLDAQEAADQRSVAWEAVEVARGKGQYQSRNGHPADYLPPYIRQVSGFGERPEWSHDGRRILFVEKPMGEVYELDLESGLIHPKTRHFYHYGFTRANYLANGDILLSGPNQSFDVADKQIRNDARHQCWLSVLKNDGQSKPVPLGTLAAEGPAVSRKHLRIAWTHRDRQDPSLGKNHARHFVADIEYHEGLPRLANQKVVFESNQLPFQLGPASLETQDFAGENDRQLIFSVYQIENGNNTDTYIVDRFTGEFENLTRSPNYYDEPEGVFPDGKHVCVEHAPCAHSAWPLSDIYKLKLDGSGEMQRLTYFSDFVGFKGTQGVVSDDGTKLCFQIGKSGDEAGVGYGFFVMDLRKAAPHLESFRSDTTKQTGNSDGMPTMEQNANSGDDSGAQR